MTQLFQSRGSLAVLSIILTAAIVVVGNASTAIVAGLPVIGESSFGSIDAVDVAILHFIITGIPFFALAAKADRRKLMWSTAITLSVASWAYVAWRIWRASLTGFAGGADIGLGLIMLAAPFAILLILKCVSLVLRSHET